MQRRRPDAIPARRAARATRRYSAPLSSRRHPRACATARLTVPLPDPDGPSMVRTGTAVMTGALTLKIPRHRGPTERASSTNPGKEVATLATSRIAMRSAARRLATLKAIAIR